MADFKRLNETNKLVSFLGNGKVNIVAGLRRSGKTYLLTELFKKHLIEKQIVLEQEIGILNLSDKNRDIETLAQLDFAVSKFVNNGIKVLIVDEAQLINGYVKFFSDFVKDNKNITLYISGSNSDILSLDIVRNFKELANPLYLRSLTYKEIIEEKSDYSFEEYMLYGGLPSIINEQPEKRVAELHRIYDEVYELDIRDRLEGKLNYLAKKHINEILSLLASSASPFSPSQVATRFTKGVDNTKFDMMLLIKDIEDVLEFFDNSFLTSYIEVDDFNEKTPLNNIGLNKKYYFSDNGIRYINCENQNKARSNCLENAVYLELVSRGINPRGKIILNKKREVEGEIDFNFRFNSEEYHIQVAHTITTANYDREIGNFNLINTKSLKMLVYLYDFIGIKEETIKCLQSDSLFKLDGFGAF
ncbi:MAG: ATP-binding protein [Clostridia bacterium]|nr:ATP-binding protein [Bacilli bacterium]MBQ9657869.1 ATP-binding protein [Clostridia bacterium]